VADSATPDRSAPVNVSTNPLQLLSHGLVKAKRETVGAQSMRREIDQVNRTWTVTSFAGDFTCPYGRNFVRHEVVVLAGLWTRYDLANVWSDR
jgi:hypothetical protein